MILIDDDGIGIVFGLVVVLVGDGVANVLALRGHYCSILYNLHSYINSK